MNNKINIGIAVGMLAGGLFITLPVGLAFAETVAPETIAVETLNPEGVNPHTEDPHALITLEQKEAAAEARKIKKAEIEARKKARGTKANGQGQVAPLAQPEMPNTTQQ